MMNTATSNLKSTVLIDRKTAESMTMTALIGRIQQMDATGRYADIHVDYRLGAIVAKVLA